MPAIGRTSSDATIEDEQDRAVEAARAALARARAAARERGLRPGMPAPRRTPRPTARSGTGPDGRDPQPLATGLERLVGDRGWEIDVAVGGVMGRWAAVVGPDIASHCAPETFDEGVLVVRADSTAWATQVRLLVPTLMRRLEEEVGAGTVSRVVVKGPAGPTWRKGPRTTRGRGPRDTYG